MALGFVVLGFGVFGFRMSCKVLCSRFRAAFFVLSLGMAFSMDPRPTWV